MKKRKLVGFDTQVWFGKHKNYSIRDIYLSDPQYLIWAFDKGIIDFCKEDLEKVTRAARILELWQKEAHFGQLSPEESEEYDLLEELGGIE